MPRPIRDHSLTGARLSLSIKQTIQKLGLGSSHFLLPLPRFTKVHCCSNIKRR